MADLTNESVRDASDVGVPCSICSSIDFLPFRCAHCRRAFCKEHSSAALPEEHDCPDYKSTIVSKSEQGKDGTATFKSLLPDRSTRPEVAQPTREDLEKQRKKEAALALLHKNFPNTNATGSSSASKTSHSSSTNKPPQSKTIMIMKLKQNAKALDPLKNEKQVPIKERRFFFARSEDNGDVRPFWLAKTCSCGKALDLLATALKLPNKNNVATTPASERVVLVTKSISDSSVILPSAKSIGDAIADGDEVRICRSSEVSA